jgi:hypothetical protein
VHGDICEIDGDILSGWLHTCGVKDSQVYNSRGGGHQKLLKEEAGGFVPFFDRIHFLLKMIKLINILGHQPNRFCLNKSCLKLLYVYSQILSGSICLPIIKKLLFWN